MTVYDTNTVVITGPTRGLGLATVRALAARPPAQRPDIVLLGRPGAALEAALVVARATGATARAIGVDLASRSSVGEAATAVRSLVARGDVRPLGAIVANAGLQTTDIGQASADGYELTFAVNHLAHFQLVTSLQDLLPPGSRVVLVGSGTHRGGWFQRRLQVPDPRWEDPVDLAKPGLRAGETDVTVAARRAYATSKLAALYFAHELQRRLGEQRAVAVFDPGLMPGTGLARAGTAGVRMAWNTVMKGLRVLPGITSPEASGRVLAALAVDPAWAHLRGGAYIELTRETSPSPESVDPARERRLWEASGELVGVARAVEG